MKLGIITSGFFLAAIAVVACASDDGAVSTDRREVDCRNVCNKVDECVSNDSDERKCTDDCLDKSRGDDVYRAKVKECAECVEGKSCTEARSCVGDCLRVYLP